MITLYGIKNCDTVKKARKWLETEGVPHTFHDFRKDGLDAAMVERFEAALGWEALLNMRGTTWRKLAAEDKADVDATKAKALMVMHDAIIKRPVWERMGDYRVGFAPKDQDVIKSWAKG